MGNTSPHRKRSQSRTNNDNQYGGSFENIRPDPYQNSQNYNYYPNPNAGYDDRFNQKNRNPNYPQRYPQSPYQNDLAKNHSENFGGKMPPPPPQELNIVNLDNKYGNSAPPLIIDLNPRGKEPLERINPALKQVPPYSDKEKQIVEQTPSWFETFGSRPQIQEPNNNKFLPNQMNYNVMPPYNGDNRLPPNQMKNNFMPPPYMNGDNKMPPQQMNNNFMPLPPSYMTGDNKLPQYQMNNNFPPYNANNKRSPHNQYNQNQSGHPINEQPNKFNPKYEKEPTTRYQDDSYQRPPPGHQMENPNSTYEQQQGIDLMQNPDYYRQDYYKNKGRGVPVGNDNQSNPFALPPARRKPSNDTSLEKQLNNNNSFMSKEESYMRDKKGTLDNILLKKENDTKIKEKDLMDKNADGVNKDYNNVFLNTQQQPNLKNKNDLHEVAVINRRPTPIFYKSEGFEKLEEVTNIFLKKKFISKDEKTSEDFSHFFIFPGTTEYNQLNINPLFYVLYNDDFKSKYCCL